MDLMSWVWKGFGIVVFPVGEGIAWLVVEAGPSPVNVTEVTVETVDDDMTPMARTTLAQRVDGGEMERRSGDEQYSTSIEQAPSRSFLKANAACVVCGGHLRVEKGDRHEPVN